MNKRIITREQIQENFYLENISKNFQKNVAFMLFFWVIDIYERNGKIFNIQILLLH